MERKSGIAAIILSGVIAFGIAGDIHPASASASAIVSRPESSQSEQEQTSSGNMEQLCGMIVRAMALPFPELTSSQVASSEESTVSTVKSETVVMTKEEIVAAAKKPQTTEEKKEAQKEDPQKKPKPVQDEIAPSKPINTIPNVPAASSQKPIALQPPDSSQKPASSAAPSKEPEHSSDSGASGSTESHSSEDTAASAPDSSEPSHESTVSSDHSSTADSSEAPAVPDGWITRGEKQFYGYQGKYLTGWYAIGGRKYYFDASGELISRTMIDVSEYQGTINWKQVKASGVDYVMIRIGFRGYGITSAAHPTWGGLKKDSSFESNYKGAKAAGLKVGVYFFTEAINDQEARDEATFVMAILNGRSLDLPIAFDIEDKGEDSTHRVAGLTQAARTSMCKAFCDSVSAAGYQPCIYASVNFTVTHISIAELQAYPTWIAHWTPGVTTYKYPFRMWQYSSGTGVDGISAAVDLNVWFPNNFKIS